MPPIFDIDPLLAVGALLLSPFYMLPMFLVGMAMAKQRWFSNPSQQTNIYRHGWWLLAIGLTMKLFAHLEGWEAFTGIFAQSGGQLLAIGYVFVFAHLYVRYQRFFLFTVLESMGKLSLTNYLMQSVIMTFIFYGYGLGYYQQISIAGSIFIGILVYVAQCLCSVLYLKYAKRGPVEYLLRMWTNLSWRGKVKEANSSHIKSA
jgi:uncharacterized protein